MIEFAKSTGMKVIFGLNALVGRTQSEPYWNYTGAWDSSNAEELLNEFATTYPDSIFAYELGNEVICTQRLTLADCLFRLLENMALQLILLPINMLLILLNCSKSAIKPTKTIKRFHIFSESITHLISNG